VSLTGHTLDETRRDIRARLQAAGIETPELDARLLLEDVLQLDLTGLMIANKRKLDAHEAATLEALIARRIAGEPVARILGHKEFWGLPLALSPATLVPRPDTETIVEAALGLLKQEGRLNDALRIADLGTGSGAILLALLSELPNAHGIGTDINPEAIKTATANATALGLGDRAAFFVCDYASALHTPFDLIVSNPPYIPSRDIDDLAIEVRAHDPRLALDGGADGLDAYRVIAPAAFELLVPRGVVVVEVGQGQEGDVARLMAEKGLDQGAPAKVDLNGIPRAVMARKPLI